MPNVFHSAAPGSRYVFGVLVRMNDVQYAWIVGFNSAPFPVAMSQMEYMVAACMAPIPDLALMGGTTSQLLLVRDGMQREKGAYW